MATERISNEEWPLQGTFIQTRPRFKGPLRVVKLCVLGIAIPSALISVPLYMRYHVYVDQLYPFAVSDMRVLDGRISTFWCQKQLVKVNATFNAYLMPKPPAVLPDQKTISMTRELLLEDDMKEYWGFYLLSGSSVTVSTCVRWPGASLIMIRGHKHLQECAYIGDDSSEEMDELLEIVREHLFGKNHNFTVDKSSSSESVANVPDFMKRHRPDIRFHHPLHNNVAYNKSNDILKQMDTTDISDPELMRGILAILSEKTDKQKKRRQELINKYNLQNNINKTNEKRSSSEELFKEIVQKLDALGDRQNKVIDMLNKRMNRTKREILIETARGFNEHDEARNAAIEEGFVPDGIADMRGFVNETTPNDRSNSEFWSSFSSSEEALLNCAGLILNLPLSPHHNCIAKHSDEKLLDAAAANTITYRVPSNGYYFFVFSSENEVQVNYVRVRFQLNKTMYDVSHPVESCSNTTESCELDLQFFSNEKTIMELPMFANETRWNDEFVVISECQPRTAIYVFCVLSVPIMIIVFAFQ